MKHARAVIELMSAYPMRDFRMIELVRVASTGASEREKHATRIAVSRVVNALAEAGSVIVRPHHAKRGGFALYRWKA